MQIGQSFDIYTYMRESDAIEIRFEIFLIESIDRSIDHHRIVVG